MQKDSRKSWIDRVGAPALIGTALGAGIIANTIANRPQPPVVVPADNTQHMVDFSDQEFPLDNRELANSIVRLMEGLPKAGTLTVKLKKEQLAGRSPSEIYYLFHFLQIFRTRWDDSAEDLLTISPLVVTAPGLRPLVIKANSTHKEFSDIIMGWMFEHGAALGISKEQFSDLQDFQEKNLRNRAR